MLQKYSVERWILTSHGELEEKKKKQTTQNKIKTNLTVSIASRARYSLESLLQKVADRD